VTTAQIAIPAVLIAGALLVLFSRMVARHNAARAHGRHENGHTVHHDGPPLTAKRLPSARDRAAAFSELATPCPRCGVDHIGGCGMRPGPASLPAHLRPGVVLPPTPKLALAPALEPLPDEPIYLLPDPGLIAGDPVVRTRGLAEPGFMAGPLCIKCKTNRVPLPHAPGMSAYFCPACLDMCHEALEFDHCCMICATPEEARALGWPVVDGEHDLTITAGPGADEAYQDVVNAGMHDARTPDVGQGTDKSGTAQRATGSLSGSESAKAQTPPAAHPNRPDGQTTGEIFEHLCEGTGCWCHSFRRLPAPPGWAVELNHGYSDNTEAVESMFTRAQADQVNAALAQAEAAASRSPAEEAPALNAGQRGSESRREDQHA
jgi:hypothetical protein